MLAKTWVHVKLSCDGQNQQEKNGVLLPVIPAQLSKIVNVIVGKKIVSHAEK